MPNEPIFEKDNPPGLIVVTEQFRKLGFAMENFSRALTDSGRAFNKNINEDTLEELRLWKARLTRRERIALRVMDIAERLAGWIMGEENA